METSETSLATQILVTLFTERTLTTCRVKPWNASSLPGLPTFNSFTHGFHMRQHLVPGNHRQPWGMDLPYGSVKIRTANPAGLDLE
jgi:hypothetical protein